MTAALLHASSSKFDGVTLPVLLSSLTLQFLATAAIAPVPALAVLMNMSWRNENRHSWLLADAEDATPPRRQTCLKLRVILGFMFV